jgi:2-polyprenyl-3-methyl-5-hydroxy-6-metoxy-1,4-benzoquinol methylase
MEHESGPTESTYRYERAIDVDTESTHARVVRLVGTDQRVLELGPAAGHMTRVLRDRGCSVVGIEVDPDKAELAGEFAERVIVGDLDALNLDEELGSERFDVIVAADVLEHLTDPLSALRTLKRFLAPDGYFVISLPNIAHGSVRIALLQGHFDYQNVGLLDTTHLRFFTRESIGRLLDDAELAAGEIFHQQLDIAASEVPFDLARVPPELLEELSRDPEARTYQFVIKALPLDAPGLRELQRRLRELAHENARLRETANDTLATLSRREDQLRSALINAHDQVLRRDEEIHRLHEELGVDEEIHRLHEELGVAQKEAAAARQLRLRLERITNSPPGRAYAMLSEFPGVKQLREARTAGYNRALRRARDSGGPAS